MYVGDMGGRVWRFDIINGQQGNNLVKGGVFASLGAADLASPTLPNVRRFYVTPDVARYRDGSWRLSERQSRLRATASTRSTPPRTTSSTRCGTFTCSTSWRTMPTGHPSSGRDLTDITGNVSPSLAYNSPGWRLRLDMSAGEKVLNSSRTFANQVYFTSFSPGNTGDACVAAGGSNRLYMISVRDGAPVQNLDGSTDASEPHSRRPLRVLSQSGIAPEVHVLLHTDRRP